MQIYGRCCGTLVSFDSPHGQTQMIRLAALALLAACGAAPPEPRADPAAPATSATATRTADGDTLIRPATPKYGYTLLDSATADVDGDGAAERVELAATVELDASGGALWEDGHSWMVAVRDGADTYPLVERFVPWGGAAFWVVAQESAGPAAILVQTGSGGSGGGGMRLEKFVFSRARAGYVRTGAVEAFGNPATYRGPPARDSGVPPGAPLRSRPARSGRCSGCSGRWPPGPPPAPPRLAAP